MTEQPLASADLELDKALRLLAVAEHLLSAGYNEDAISRAYYAAFHAACALLASIGRTVRTHEGLRAAVGEHFIRTGKLPARFSRYLTRAAADRNDADYNCASTYSAEDAAESISNAKEIVTSVMALLQKPPTSC
jgi:uncharacterized protein (UPF0332 family)